MKARRRCLGTGFRALGLTAGVAVAAAHAGRVGPTRPAVKAEAGDTLAISAELAGHGSVELQTRLPGEAAWTAREAKPLPPQPRALVWLVPQYRVPNPRDAFQYRFVGREGGRPRVLLAGEGPLLAAPVPELSPAVEGYTLTYYLLDPRPLRVTLQVWDPVVGANLLGGGRWVTVHRRRYPAGLAARVTEPISSPFDCFDVGRPSSYRLQVSYGAETVLWRQSASFAVSGTSWLTYGAVAALLLLGGGTSAALWPLVRSRARLQEQLRLVEVRSQERQRGMTLLANKIGHEAEAWMASIRWLNALLQREVGGSSRAGEYVTELERAADQLSGYLLRLKEYGRPPSETRAPVRLSEALRMARLRADHSLEAAGVEVRERFLPDAWVMGDESEIVAALGNLIENAAEAMAQGERHALTLTVQGADPGQIAVEIRDTGHGIPEGIAGHLFDPFRSTRGEGRGLGLAIARKNVEAHGGTVEWRREPDGGTTFRVTLPGSRDAAGPAPTLLDTRPPAPAPNAGGGVAGGHDGPCCSSPIRVDGAPSAAERGG